MTNSNNVEQFNAQVKRMSDRLRGESASPADTQTNEGVVEEGPNTLGIAENNVGTAASSPAHQQVRKKGAGGRRGAGMSRQGTSGPPVPDGANTTSTQVTQAGDETTEKDGETLPELGDIPESTATQPVITADESESGLRRNHPDGAQTSNQPEKDTGRSAQDSDAPPTADAGDLIAPEVIRRAITSVGTCKPRCLSFRPWRCRVCEATSSDATDFVMPP